ncbi:acylphosphatase [soil metagenome]
MPHLNLKITGKVQGVYYRESMRQKAHDLGMKGFVRNEADGSVYAEIEGEQPLLDKMVAWCHQGPDMATVQTVTVTEAPMADFDGFEVRR